MENRNNCPGDSDQKQNKTKQLHTHTHTHTHTHENKEIKPKFQQIKGLANNTHYVF